MNYIYSGQNSTLAYSFRRVSLLFVALLFALSGPSLYATNFTVTDSGDSNTGSGTVGTLRYCINQANLSVGPHTITFAVSTVNLTGNLPAITRQVDVNGGGTVTVSVPAGDGGYIMFTIGAGGGGSTLQGMTIQNTGYIPIYLSAVLSDITLRDLVIKNNAADYIDYAVYAPNAVTNLLIKNVDIFDIQFGSWWGLYFGGNTNGVTIDDVNMSSCGGGDDRAIQFIGGTNNNLLINNCTFDIKYSSNLTAFDADEGNYGIYFNGSATNVVIDSVNIPTAEVYGIRTAAVTNFTISNCNIGNERGWGQQIGIRFEGVADQVTITNTVVDQDHTIHSDNGDYGVHFNTNVSNLNIDGLTIHDSDIHQFSIWGALTGVNTISNCTFDTYDTYLVGGGEVVRFNSTIAGLTMTNVFVDCDVTGTTNDRDNGIAFANNISTTTLNNVSVNEADDNGIYTWTAISNFTINGGKLTNNYDGIEFHNCYNRTNVDLNNMKIDNSTRYGVIIPGCNGGVNDDIDMTGDTITNSGYDGVFIFNNNVATDITISGCVLSGNGRTSLDGDGIRIENPDNIVITQNSIFNNAGIAINVRHNGNCNLEGTLAPVINSVTPLGGGQYQISFTIPAAAGAGTYKAEFFTNNPIAGPEGEYYVHTVSGLSTGTHTTTFTTTTGPAANSKEASVTMTYTRTGAACNGTSEFSNALGLNPSGPACVNTGILGWYRPDKLTGYTNGQAVEQLLDFSGSSNKFRQYVAAEKPLYFSGDASTNFNPSLTFDGAGDNFEIGNGILPINTGGSIFAAAYNTNVASTWADLYNQNIDDPVFHKAASSQNIGLLDNGNVFYEEPTMKWVNNITALGGLDYGTIANSTHLYFNGRSTANLGGTASPEAGIGYIGGENTGESWTGKIHEMIFYNRSLTATERQKVNSYLSIKWGTSIDTTIMKVAGAGNNYITSDGTVIWTANNTYYHRITGIGRDDCTELLQKQSRNVNTSSPGYPTIGLGTIAANNPSNANTFAADKNFMLWADDGKIGSGTTTITGDGVISLMGGTCAQYSRLAKTFKIQETGTVGSVQVEFNMSGVKLGKVAADYYLAINSTSTFSGTITKLVAATSYNPVTGVVVFDNVDFTDGQFFTVVGKRVYGPANITSNLKLWLKAEDGIELPHGSQIPTWADQGPAANDAKQANSALQPIYNTTSNLLNFNPTVSFNGSNQRLGTTGSVFGTGSLNYSAFGVVNSNTISGNHYWLFDGQTTCNNAVGFAHVNSSWYNINFCNDHVTNTLSANTAYIELFTRRGTAPFTRDNIINGKSTGILNSGGLNKVNGAGFVGSRGDGIEYWNGTIGEIIAYEAELPTLDQQKINSYLAVKWGVTLDQTTAYNYVGSDGTVIWNATTNATYKNRITGIGRDDCSDLNQKQSRNQDTATAYVTMSLGTLATTNTGNTNTFAADKSFLLWGDDNATGISAAAITGDGTITLNSGACGVFKRLAKTFKVQETGTIGDVQVQVALRGASLGKVAGDFYLAIHSSATFSGVITKLVPASSYTNGVLTFDNVDFASGQFFTVIGQRSEGPANLTSHLKLWLRADDGLTLNGNAVSAWADQGPAGSNVAQASPANQPIYNSSSNLINFNPSLSFDGANDYLRPTSPIYGTGSISYTNFGVVSSNLNSGNRYWLSDGSAACNNGVAFGHSGLSLTNVNWCNDHISGITTLNQVQIEGFTRNASGPLRTNYFNGYPTAATPVSTAGGLNKLNGVTSIGSTPIPNEFWSGQIGEIIAYDTILSLANQQKINSYLAVKWGLTLDQSSPYNYVAANGTVVWDATAYASYKNRITGIARDDCSNLLQKQSKNQDAGSLVTISNGSSISTTNDENASTFSADNSWLLFGDNNKGVTWTGSGVPINGGNVRLNRVWRVEETGTVGTVYLEVPDNTSSLATKLPATTFNIYLLVANSGTNGRFNALAGVTVQQMTFDATNKKWYTTYNFADGDYFTFGSEKTCIAPVGISEGLTAWYHATNMPTGAIAVNTANAISDQAFGVYPLNRNGVGTATVLAGSATSFNYNRSISLTGNAAFSKGSLTNADVLSAPAGSMFAVGTSNANLFNLSSSSLNVSGIGSNAQFNGTASTYGAGTFGTPNVYSLLGSTAGVTGYTNGTAGTTSGSIGGRGVATYTLGWGQNGSNATYNNSNIAEAFAFDRVLDAFEKDILESYLAIKYGQTLSHNYYNADYDGTNAATTTIYDISTYPYRVFGIGNDTTGCFHQKQSTSALAGSMLKMGVDTIAAENNSNTAVFLQDRAYVMAGDDNALANAWLTGGGGNPSSPTIYASTCELPTRIARQWKVTATYNNPPLAFAIPDATSSALSKLPTVPAGYSVWMVVNENTDFAVNALQEEVAMTLNPSTKHWEATYQINAGITKYITFVLKNDAIATGSAQPTVVIASLDNSCTPDDGKVLSGATTTLVASGAATYTWSHMMTMNDTLVVNPLATTTYTVTATAANGCKDTVSATVTIVSAVVGSLVETDNSCTPNDGKILNAASATLTVSGGGTYLWDNASTAAVRVVTPFSTTTYTVTITDANGCADTLSSTVTIINAPIVSVVETDNSCTANDGKVLSAATATLTASGGSTYLWENASTAAVRMVSPTSTTTYTVTVTDVNGCTATVSNTVTVVSAPIATITETDNSCTVDDNKVLSGAAATLTASGGGTYTWDDASTAAMRVVNPTMTTTYTVTVSDANGCTATANRTITIVTAPTASIVETDNSCTPNDGKVLSGAPTTLTASGGGSYNWDDASSLAVRVVFPATNTTYTVTVTDANGCTATASNSVTVVTGPTASIVETDNSCTPNDGKVLSAASVTLTASGGGTYTWDDASSAAIRMVSPSSTTTYSVTVSDANGCTATASNTVTVVSAPAASIAATDNSCTPNDSKVLSGAAVTLTASGGSTYLWDNASINAVRNVNPISTTIYMVTATDANGCTATANKTITIVSAPTVVISTSENSCTPNDSKVLTGSAVTLTASGGGTYLWDNASNAAIRVINPSSTTTYFVTMTDANGCTVTEGKTITVITMPVVNIAETDNSCSSNDSKVLSGGTATLMATGGTIYLWDDASSAPSRNVTPVVTTTYTVTVTDINGCTATGSATVTVVSPPTASISSADNSCTANDEIIAVGGSATLTASGGVTYSWDNSSTAAIRNVSPVVTTTFTVTVTDVNGCTATANKKITVIAFCGVSIAAKVFLGATYDDGTMLMSDNLRAANLIPLNQPYGGSEYSDFAYSGTEATTAPVLGATGNNAIVDWVIVEIRDSLNPVTVVARKAALLQRDGDVVDVDGVSPLLFSGTDAGNYFVAIRHRNHLGVMTGTKVALLTAGSPVDFTSSSTSNYQLSGVTGSPHAQRSWASGKRSLWPGNTGINSNTEDEVIYQGSNSDVDEIYFKVLLDMGNTMFLPNYIVPGTYSRMDANLDGMVVYQGSGSDPDVPFFAILQYPLNALFLPNYTLFEQIPK